MQLELPGRRGRVDPFIEAHERHACGVQILEQHHEMPEVSAEAIEPPAQKHIDLPPPGVHHELIERRTTVLRAADTAVDVFNGGY
jgi:hypothetical protein